MVKILFFIALISTVLALLGGLILYFVGGTLNEKYGNFAMRCRVLCQAMAILLFFLMLR